jgi:hypothetical protein
LVFPGFRIGQSEESSLQGLRGKGLDSQHYEEDSVASKLIQVCSEEKVMPFSSQTAVCLLELFAMANLSCYCLRCIPINPLVMTYQSLGDRGDG